MDGRGVALGWGRVCVVLKKFPMGTVQVESEGVLWLQRGYIVWSGCEESPVQLVIKVIK